MVLKLRPQKPKKTVKTKGQGQGGAGLSFLDLGVSQGVVPRVPGQTGRGGLSFAETETYCMFFSNDKIDIDMMIYDTQYVFCTLIAFFLIFICCCTFTIFFSPPAICLLHEPSLVYLLIELQAHFCFEWNCLVEEETNCSQG